MNDFRQFLFSLWSDNSINHLFRWSHKIDNFLFFFFSILIVIYLFNYCNGSLWWMASVAGPPRCNFFFIGSPPWQYEFVLLIFFRLGFRATHIHLPSQDSLNEINLWFFSFWRTRRCLNGDLSARDRDLSRYQPSRGRLIVSKPE